MPVRLQRDMIDAEALREQALCSRQRLRPFGGLADQHVRRQRGAIAGHMPDMQIVNRSDAGHARQSAANLFVRQMRRHAFHQHAR